MVWRAAVEGEARMFAGRGGFFASSEVRLVRRLGGPAVVPFRCRWLLGPPDWVCEQFFGANTPPMSYIHGAARASYN